MGVLRVCPLGRLHPRASADAAPAVAPVYALPIGGRRGLVNSREQRTSTCAPVKKSGFGEESWNAFGFTQRPRHLDRSAGGLAISVKLLDISRVFLENLKMEGLMSVQRLGKRAIKAPARIRAKLHGLKFRLNEILGASHDIFWPESCS